MQRAILKIKEGFTPTILTLNLIYDLKGKSQKIRENDPLIIFFCRTVYTGIGNLRDNL
jgi:hypothetical protein